MKANNSSREEKSDHFIYIMLIELLVVIGIIAILASLLFPADFDYS